ncbi:hypothetical protein BSKO_12768 [Bryopsis sp. KO-2023]|nr:hypothetical protein BSKO_12768 [Bryopsis sp. KO-2023]
MDEKLVRQAEAEMRRSAPDVPARPRKKRKANSGPGGKMVVEAGRFDYQGLDDISEEVKGFIVSCVFERQRSAMHEFMNFIGEYLPIIDPNAPKHIIFESEDEKEPQDSEPKEEKEVETAQSEEKNPEDSEPKEKEAETVQPKEKTSEDSQPDEKVANEPQPDKKEADDSQPGKKQLENSKPTKKAPQEGKSTPCVKLRPVKISCQGVVFFKMEGWEKLPVEMHPTNVVKKIINGLEMKGRLRHCQRIFPVEGVCEMKEDSLKTAVGSVVSNFKQQESEEWMDGLDSFAVVFKGRGNQKSRDLDKNKAIRVMATAMEEKLSPKKMKVDLKTPKVALMVEGLPTAKYYLGCVCVVDHRFLSYGSKLCMKPTGFHCQK